MTAVVFYFQVHQPYRLAPFHPSDVGQGKQRFDDSENRRIVRRVADRCYLPMNEILLQQIAATDGRFRCSFSLSGTLLQQLSDWVPAVVDSFVALADTGCVEFLAETSHHSLAFDRAPEEFEHQVEAQRSRIEQLFGQRPTTFRNTELCIDEDVARRVERLGFDVLLGEGADRLLGWRSPQLVYRPRGCERLKLLLRSYVFSDDIAFRFSNKCWSHYPLFADTFAGWLHAVPEQAQFLGLFMDYETFGEHQWAEETGILEFMRHLPGYVLENPRFSFQTPCELAASCEPAGVLPIPDTVSWADQERDLSAWLGNDMQQAAHRELYLLERKIRARPELLEVWRRLTTSDHVYYMCTKYFTDGDVHKYFSPYDTPHEAFVRFMSVLDDLKSELSGPRSGPVGEVVAGGEPIAEAPVRPATDVPRAPQPDSGASPGSGRVPTSKRASNSADE